MNPPNLKFFFKYERQDTMNRKKNWRATELYEGFRGSAFPTFF